MKIPTHRKMTFGEFVASEDSEIIIPSFKILEVEERPAYLGL